MKLSYKKIFFVGIAFCIISLFWQTYDAIVPKILVEKFGMNQSLSGFVMALDNILSLFLLPLFGYLSDKTKTKIGKRTPYIIIGTLLAAVFFLLTTFADNMQIAKIEGIENNQVIVSSGVLEEPSLKINGVQIKDALANKGLSEQDFINISPSDTENFTEFVKPARTAFAWKITIESPITLIVFMGLLLFVLLSMAVFRSPAVALMPDVTIKPLRSKANAVINLMGAVGGIIVILLGILFKTGNPDNTYMSYTAYFGVIAALMIIFLIIFLFKVKEPKLVEETQRDIIAYGLKEEEKETEVKNEKMPKEKLRSLLFLLTSIFLWFMAYNAVTSKFTVYAGRILNMDFNPPLIIAQAVAIIAFIPIGFISSKFGRKKSILVGIIVLTISFGAAYFINANTTFMMYVVFIFAGLGWATINVNSYPMVVEMSKGSNVGRYTGFYYSASMAAQILTPIISGILMDLTSMHTLFPYATAFIAIAFITMLFVKHGDSNMEKKPILESFETIE